MVMEKSMTALTLKDLWKEVKSEEEWLGDFSERVVGMAKLILESSLDEELLEQLRAGRYQRTEARKGYRNGCYRRSLFMPFGVIKSLRVPRSRQERVSHILTNYQRQSPKINRMIKQMFLAGVSTRRVGEVLKAVWGRQVSPQTVSNVCRSLDRQVEAYHRRPLADDYHYLFFDGIVLKVKGAAGVKKRPVLACYGITLKGRKELVDFRLASSESTSQWEAFLNSLYLRGLTGAGVRLITIDGCAGLRNGIQTVYPFIPVQRCWAHKLRNVSNYLKRSDQEACIQAARSIYLAQNRRQAAKSFRHWKDKWVQAYPKATRCLERDLDELLNFLGCPVCHRVKVRTTNAIERSFREVRRRTRTMSCFTNTQSVERIIYGVISHLNKCWEDKPLIEFTQDY
jgi:transposase-like protein